MSASPFVPDEFEVPTHLDGPGFHLEPLGPEHNVADYAAWTSSIDHIRATPGFAESSWPTPMSLDANLDDLVRHRRDFEDRTGFTYTVLDTDGVVVGCVYIYPARPPATGAAVQSWVSADRAGLDVLLWQTVSTWLASTWPFEVVTYAERDSGDDTSSAGGA